MFFFDFSKPYVAVIGDIVCSRTLRDRGEVQQKLWGVLQAVNERYEEDIASDFMITLGDEFQGLLKRGAITMDIVEEIEDRMYPVSIRFAIGVGEITTDIDRRLPLGADGPAYHNARRVMNELKSAEKKPKSPGAYKMMASQGDNGGTDLLLNSILMLCSVIKRDWSPRQREIISAYRACGDQSRAADSLGITQSSVHKGLTNANYYSYQSALDTMAKAFSEIGGDDNV